MATTTATIILSSTDLLSDTLDLNTTATLTGAGNSTGLTLANGLSRKKTGDTNQYTLATASDWALLPWSADEDATPDADIKITPSAASMTLEHMVFIDS